MATLQSLNQLVSKHDYQGWVLPIAFVLIWSIAAYFNWVNPKLIPAPYAVLDTAWQQLFAEDFFTGAAASLLRNVSGFLIGGVSGIAVGVLLGVSRWADRLFSPSFNALRQVSLFAWLPLISSWFGYGNDAKILFIALSAFYPVALNTFEGVRSISLNQLEVAKVYGFNQWQLITRLILPAASPQILIGLQLALVFAWLATIGSELLLASWGIGLGNIVIRGREAFNVPLIIFGMLIIGLVGALLNRIAQRAESRLLRWRGNAD
ncbi:MAG: ABC transporter permease [Methylotenera sp.]|nr:ABC transporter permease [Methylotenera sp.]MDD4925519.1 ABC transporter permease [Methylotenera sp.]